MRSHEVLHNISQALSLVVSGAYVLTLHDREGRPHAILLSFVQQVGFDPPRIVLALHKQREIVALVEERREFVLNIIAAGRESLCEELAALPGDPGEALAAGGAKPASAGLTLDDSCGHMHCQVVERVDMRDHWLYIAEVVDGAAVPGRRPLVHTRASGLRY